MSEQTVAPSSCCTTDGSCHSDAAAADAPQEAVSTVYQVTGMTCGHCKSAVTREISALDGVRAVHVELSTGRVTVTSDDEPDDALVAEAVDEAGYELTGRA
ncbi:copper chaperone [Streptomyces armeniacus]|uniref:Copper chaperone n=1 Tax=Streptomyces armeniacus TaxID=83291 RepID=A0A345XRX4_9ACTN|nr:heavy-metal-associated domain-containing protein [Streptomyces armeniacus]AXK34390.1 copper chaperone [Streptomyces armeniacus]